MHAGKHREPVGGCAAPFESKAACELITLCGCLVIQTGTLSAIYTNKNPLELAAHHLHQWEFMAPRQTETCALGDVAALMRGGSFARQRVIEDGLRSFFAPRLRPAPLQFTALTDADDQMNVTRSPHTTAEVEMCENVNCTRGK